MRRSAELLAAFGALHDCLHYGYAFHTGSRLTPELSDRRPAVITPVTLDHQSARSKPPMLQLRSGAPVRSSDVVGRVITVQGETGADASLRLDFGQQSSGTSKASTPWPVTRHPAYSAAQTMRFGESYAAGGP